MTTSHIDDDWLFEFHRNLIQFKQDLDLIIDDDYKIHIAVDFYDIFRFSFPYAKFLHMDTLFNKPSYMNDYYNAQVSRCTMFFMLSNFYIKPNILLAPYATECSNFKRYLDQQAERYVYYEIKSFQENPNHELLEAINDYKINNNITKMINYLNRNYPQLIYHFSRGYTNSISIYYDLLINNLTNDLEILFGEQLDVRENLYDILSESDDQQKFYINVKELVKEKRNRKDKIANNQRDAEGIKSIHSLNKIYNNDKMAFFLVSSAPHLVNLMESDRLNVCTMNIKNKAFKILRNPRYFMDIMLEISNYFNYIMNKKKLEEINPIDLRLAIKNDLLKLEFYNSYLIGSGGVFKDEIIDQAASDLKLVHAINKRDLNLTILIDEYLTIKDNLRIYNPVDQEAAVELISIFAKDTFNKELFLRRLEVEKAHIKFLITQIKGLTYNINVVLFSHPFRLNLNNPNAKIIIEKIIELNANGRNEFRLVSENKKNNCKDLISQLIELLDCADSIKDNEKLILWQLIFLYIGRYDLVDHLYDVFHNSVEDDILTEITYLYVVSFIKKFRAIGVYDVVLLFKMVKLCDKYIYREDGNINESIDLYDILPVEDKIHILKHKQKETIYISTLKEIHPGIKTKQVDIRFFHLKATLINRFIHDYGSIYPDMINKIINEYRLIFVPIVNHFDDEYKIAILSDLAYFSVLNTSDKDYATKLERALIKMRDLRTSIDLNSEGKEHYWGYVRSYQYGYINLKYHFGSNEETKLRYVQESKKFFELSLKELPEIAQHLRKIVQGKIELCNGLIEVLK